MTNRIKHDLSPQGIGELMKAPIKATLSFLDFIDDEVELSVRYFCEHSQFAKSVNPLIEHCTGKEITLEMMTKTNREKADLFFAEKRIKEGKE